MLETSEERIRLLKIGMTGRDIERLYITYNNFKVVGKPLLFNFINIDVNENSSSLDRWDNC